MKVKLYNDCEHGKRGAVVDVTEDIGNSLNARGECEVIQHDPPKKGTPKGELKELDKKTKQRLDEKGGDA